MKASAFYCGRLLGDIEGDTVEELIENNFNIFSKKISDITAAYILAKVWISRKNSDVCELHVIFHGSDELINYDAREEKRTEIVFEVRGIPVDQFDSTFEFELVEKKPFDPFDEALLTETFKAVGVLEGCIDYLAESVHKESPRFLAQNKVLTAKKCKASLYISQLMLQFSLLSVKRTSRNEDVFELIEKITDVLPKLIEQSKEKIEDTTLIYYHTLTFFEQRGKITALKHYRMESGKTQGEVADAVGISLRQYQRYESVQSSLGIANRAVIEKIAETVGVKASDIVKDDVVVLK